MGFAIEDASRRWPSGIVPFVIDASIGNNAASLAAVQSAISHWNLKTCLQLVPRNGERDFVTFQEHASACQSSLGQVRNGQLISCDINSGSFGRGNVIHEIGHAVGLFHEHTRPDRDTFVVVSSGVLNNNNYRKRAGLVPGPYDCGSIMHYGPIANRIQPRPGLCGTMGQRSGLSAADIASVSHMYRVLRRGDSANLAGTSREIVLANRSGRNLLTAVRTASKKLKLISWRVNTNGSVSRQGDSRNLAGTASHIDLARVSSTRFVAACRTSSGNLKLISWNVSTGGSITRRGDSGNQAGTASRIKIAALSTNLLVTACRTADGDLKLITWRLNSNGSLTRLRDSGSLAGAVSEISLALLPGTAPFQVVTSVRTSSGSLKIISWRVGASGIVTRRGDSGNAAGAATLIRSAVDGFGQLLTSCRTSEQTLKVISWSVSANGSQLTRLGDSASQAGAIRDNSLVVHGGTRAISGVRQSNGNLRVIEWLSGDGGAVARNGDSANQAGTASLISLNPSPVSGQNSIVSAIRTSQGNLKLISWERC
jgi:hypothetical protein